MVRTENGESTRQHSVGGKRDNKPLVLIVEHDGNTCEALQLALSHSGFATRAAYSAEQALDVLAEGTPDVILLDYFIGGNLGSSDLVAVIRSRKLSSQLVLLTGVGNPMEKAQSMNIEYAVQKPCDIDELAKLVKRLT